MEPLERNNVVVSGPRGARPLVFLHGFGCDQGMWRHVAPAFSETHRVVLVDLVGAGASDLSAYDPVRHARLQGHADDLIEVLEALPRARDASGEDAGEAPVPAVLVGHSVSASIVVLVAAARPDLVSQLVLVAPNPCFVDRPGYTGGFSREEVDELLGTMDANYLAWSHAIAPVVMGRPDRPELGQELSTSFCRSDPDIARHFARTTFLTDNRADLARVATPSLVLQCRHDALAPLSVGEYVHEHLADSELVVLDAVGHCPNLSAPQDVIAAMRRRLLP